MPHEPMSNEMIVHMFGEITDRLARIETQTTKTNGSVRSLQSWRSFVTGALAVLTAVILPVVFIVLSAKIK